MRPFTPIAPFVSLPVTFIATFDCLPVTRVLWVEAFQS